MNEAQPTEGKFVKAEDEEPMRNYVADISPVADGKFRAVLAGAVRCEVVSADPEHDLCHDMVKTGLPDGRIEFRRDGIPTMRYRSVRYAAGYRIEMGIKYPYRLVKRNETVTNAPAVQLVTPNQAAKPYTNDPNKGVESGLRKWGKGFKPDETAESYPGIVAVLPDGRRVVTCRDGMQWIVQHRTRHGWKGLAHCQTKEALLRFVGSPPPKELEDLPDRIR